MLHHQNVTIVFQIDYHSKMWGYYKIILMFLKDVLTRAAFVRSKLHKTVLFLSIVTI